MEIGPEVQALIDEAVQKALQPARSALTEARTRLDTLEEQFGRLMSDPNLSRSIGSPTWMSGVSILNGTITADKLTVGELSSVTANTGTLNVTGSITAAASFPATGARVVMDSQGLYGYSGPATTTFKLNTNGSGEIGSGANKITWTTGGAVTIPAAIIQNLSIAVVGDGVIGGTYQTSNTYPRIDISVTGIKARTSASTTTFDLDAATGNLTMVGTFTLKSANSGARVEILNSGISGYNASNQRGFLLNNNGSGHLGVEGGSNSITWSPSGVSIGGISLTGSGKLTAGHLSISQLSSVSADLGSITAGTISGGTITSVGINSSTITASTMSGGTITGAQVNITGKLLLGSGGRLEDSDGSYWDQTGIILVGGGGSADNLKFRMSGLDAAGMGVDSSAAYFSAYGGRACYAYISGTQTETNGLWLYHETAGRLSGFCGFGHLHISSHGLATGFTTLGTLIGRLALYNPAGVLVGYAPVYNTIA